MKGNPSTPEKIDLGKMLYFDPRLSGSHLISCNACHNLGLGGVDLQETSIGHGWQKGPRNAPMEPFGLKEAAQKILDFIAPDLNVHQIEFRLEAEEGLVVMGYANEFSHALLNIINNAKDALLERRIASPRIDLRLFRKGEKKIVTVRDNAGGVSAETRQHLFDAYFTTKQSGTGIGLYISKIIIEKRLNGSLSADNVDNGLEIRIEL